MYIQTDYVQGCLETKYSIHVKQEEDLFKILSVFSYFSCQTVSTLCKLSVGEQHKVTKISETYHILTYIYKK